MSRRDMVPDLLADPDLSCETSVRILPASSLVLSSNEAGESSYGVQCMLYTASSVAAVTVSRIVSCSDTVDEDTIEVRLQRLCATSV